MIIAWFFRYRIVEVSDGASASFRYDELTNELRAVGPLYPGHRYKVKIFGILFGSPSDQVVIEARDADGLVGHAIVLVQALAPLLPLGTLTAFLPTKPDSPNQIALLPAQVVGQGRMPVVPPVTENPPFALSTGQPMAFLPILKNESGNFAGAEYFRGSFGTCACWDADYIVGGCSFQRQRPLPIGGRIRR